jgi:microsomal dipeptidase-like Zn-dependent dipeptidase
MEQFDTTSRIAVLENEVKNIAADVREIKKEGREQHTLLMQKMDQLDSRLSVIEKWRWMIVGGSIVIGYVIAHFFAK